MIFPPATSQIKNSLLKTSVITVEYCGSHRHIKLPFRYRRRVSSVVEHSSANPKVPGSIPGPVLYRGHGL